LRQPLTDPDGQPNRPVRPTVDRRRGRCQLPFHGRVDARQVGDNWLLTGTKPWCSLADRLSHALITAHTGEGTRRLFAISLRGATIRATADVCVAQGLVNVPSGPIVLEDCAAVPVGPDGWYLRRPGFAWGGIGVAACWYGGAVGIARTLRNAMSSKPPDQIATMHLGAVDAALTAALAVLGAAAAQIDGGSVTAAEASLLAGRVRAVVASAAEEVIIRAGHALGPAPLALDERHARRIADLSLYLRQHHAERDEAALGRAVLELDEWV
jgi:alkylation response protein AidB-like acyl-CoA dehydrogenase